MHHHTWIKAQRSKKTLFVKLLLTLIIITSLTASLTILKHAKANTPALSKDPPNIGYVKYTLDLCSNTLFNGNNNTANILTNIICISSPINPINIIYDPSNGYIYVLDFFGSIIYVINPSTNQIIDNITILFNPGGIAYDPSNGYIYVTAFSLFLFPWVNGVIYVINPSTNQVVSNITVEGTPLGITYDPSNGYLYVTSIDFSHPYSISIINTTIVLSCPYSISVINPSTNQIIASVNITAWFNVSSPWSIIYVPSNGYIYVLGGNSIYVINPSTNQIIDNITIGTALMSITYDPSNGYIYVVDSGSGAVYVINPSTNQVIGNITVTEPQQYALIDIVYDPSNGYLYVTAASSQPYTPSGVVFVINPSTNQVIGNITVGYYPTGIAYDPSNGYLYVANMGSGTISIIATTNESEEYLVTFIESGLPNGTLWSVAVNGTTKTSTTNEITFTLPPGTYTYTVGPVVGYRASPSSGIITVANSNVTQTITFTPVKYTITFIEEGLPPGASWSVTVNGTAKTSTTSKITFTLPPGTYVYSASTNVAGYVPVNRTGLFTVSGNESFVILFASVSESSMLKVYSKYIKYFFTGFNEPNIFYVKAPSIDGSQPISVTGYITLNNEAVDFTYNPSIGMWVSSTINMGQLPPGKGYLVVIAKYPNGQVLVKNYAIAVIQPPPLIITLTVKSTIHTPKVHVSSSYVFLPTSVGLYNNTFIIRFTLEIDFINNPIKVPVNVSKYLGGLYGIREFIAYVEFVFSSNGTAEISVTPREFKLNGNVADISIDITDSVTASGEINVNYLDNSIELKYLDVNDALSADATYTIPTPWSLTVKTPVGNVVIGVIVSLSIGLKNNIGLVFVPTTNPQQELLHVLPVSINAVHGHLFIPIGVTGGVGAGISENGVGLGVYGQLQGAVTAQNKSRGWGVYGLLQGVIGFGEYYQVYPVLSGRGGALLGEVNISVTISLIEFTWSGSVPILRPSVLYKWGNITKSEIDELNNQLQEASSEFAEQATGVDWVNGSTFGLIASNLPLGYGYSTASYNGSVYVYYTVLLPNGYAWINGVRFRGSYEYPAPLPSFNDLGVASPYLIQLPNGTLMMVWFAVPHGNYGLSNLTIILQGSILKPNGTWSPVFNITQSGVALSVTSDGKYLYVVWEPELNLNYTNARLLMMSLSGQVVKVMRLPNAVALNGALNGSVAVQFINGTYAVANMLTGSIEPYIGYSDVGFINGLFYAFSNDTLIIVNGSSRLVIPTPSEAYVWPSMMDGRLIVVAYRPSVLSIYTWNGTELLLLSNYTMPNLVIAKPAYSNNLIYITALTRAVNNSSIMAELWNIIIHIPSTTHNTTTNTAPPTTTNTVTGTSTTTVVNTSTSVSTTSTAATPALNKAKPIIPIILIVGIVAAIVIVATVAALRGKVKIRQGT